MLLAVKLKLQINLVKFSDVLNDLINIFKNVVIHFKTVLSTCADLVGKSVMNRGTDFPTFERKCCLYVPPDVVHVSASLPKRF
jgi:hypothetical protein